jgi:hypothetical protein
MQAIEDQSSIRAAQIWWNQAAASQLPAMPDRRALLRAPSPGLALALALLGLFFTPFAIGAWLFASGQLRDIDRGLLRDEGRGTLALAKGLGVFVTVLAVTLLVVLIVGASA